jgi:hypothetical protein
MPAGSPDVNAMRGRIVVTVIIEAWEKKHIPYTVRKKRHAFFNDGDSQNMGKLKTA